MFRTGDIQAERNPHFCVHRMEMGGTPRSGRYKSELLHRVETSEGAFSRQLVGLFGICSGDTTDRISNRCCSPFWTLIPRIVRYHPLPTFPFQSLSRLLWISLSAGAVCGVQLGRRRQHDSPRRAEAVIDSPRRAEAHRCFAFRLARRGGFGFCGTTVMVVPARVIGFRRHEPACRYNRRDSNSCSKSCQ